MTMKNAVRLLLIVIIILFFAVAVLGSTGCVIRLYGYNNDLNLAIKYSRHYSIEKYCTGQNSWWTHDYGCLHGYDRYWGIHYGGSFYALYSNDQMLLPRPIIFRLSLY
jgi:hypothetical protein